MTIEKELKNLILKRYGSILEFTNKTGLPYSTIDSIFRRGVLNSNIANVIKICEELKISVDALASNEIIPVENKKNMTSDIGIDEAIKLFSQLPTDKRMEIIDYMNFLLSKTL